MASHPIDNPGLGYLSISPQCTIVPCLYQVAGYVGNDPGAQLSGCVSQFGFPEVVTVTMPTTILTTTTATSTYTDIFISTSTELSTVEETSTSYETNLQTATEYSTTLIDTLTTTVPAPTTTRGPQKKKRDVRKRRTCTPRTTTSSTTTLSSAPFPLATNCPDLAAYSSACACIEPTFSVTYVGTTSVITEYESTTVTSTTSAVVTEPVTTVIVDPETTTLTSTLTTQTETTTTATEASSPSPAVPQTFGLVLSDGPNVGKSAVTSGNALAYTYVWASGVSPTQLGLTDPGTTPFLTSNSGYQMYVRLSTTSYGIVFFTTSAYVSSSGFTWVPVTCSLDPSTLVISCLTPNGLTRFLQCGTNFYMANPTTTPGGCIGVHLQVAS
jgi:hypothetical protein